MDAHKIKFMMSIQYEIDKKKEELGADNPTVLELKELFQILWQNEINETNLPLLNNLDLLPIKTNTETIINQVKRVTDKYDIIDKEIEQRAKKFYEDFPTTTPTLLELKDVLIKNLGLFELSLKKEDHKLASKYCILQLEGILNLFEHELISWEENNPTREYSQLRGIKTHYEGTKTMTIIAKCYSIHAYHILNFVSVKKISLVYDIRNYESHQFAINKIEQCEAKLSILKEYPNEYYEEVFKLIKQCFGHII